MLRHRPPFRPLFVILLVAGCSSSSPIDEPEVTADSALTEDVHFARIALSSHFCGVTDSGSVVCRGDSSHLQIGAAEADGTVFISNTIEVAPASAKVADVSVANGISCLRGQDGRVACWGAPFGTALPTMAQAARRPDPIALPAKANAVRLGSGFDTDFFACALLETGAVSCWGSNRYGSIGDGTVAPRKQPTTPIGLGSAVADLDVGLLSACAVLADGSVRCWGFEHYLSQRIGPNQPMHAITTPTAVPGIPGAAKKIAVRDSGACALSVDGTVACWNEDHAPAIVAGLPSDVVAVESHGATRTCALTATKEAWCWAKDEQASKLAVAGEIVQIVPGKRTCALLVDQTLRCAGAPMIDLAQPSATATTTFAPWAFPADAVVDYRGRPFGAACGTTPARGVRCWGYGAMGTGSFTPGVAKAANITLPERVAELDSGDIACARLESGAVRCWLTEGYEEDRFPAGSDPSKPVEVIPASDGATSIAVARGSVCIVRSASGALYCWGRTAPFRAPGSLPTELASGLRQVVYGFGEYCAITAAGAAVCTSHDGAVRTVVPNGVERLVAHFSRTCAFTTGGQALCWERGGPAVDPGLSPARIDAERER